MLIPPRLSGRNFGQGLTQFRGSERLAKTIDGTAADGGFRLTGWRICGVGDDSRAMPIGNEERNQIQAVAVAKAEIEKNSINIKSGPLQSMITSLWHIATPP